jgi:hypothetical protein
MSFDCAFTDPQHSRNQFIWIAVADKRYDLALSLCQLTRPLNNAFAFRHDTVQMCAFSRRESLGQRM